MEETDDSIDAIGVDYKEIAELQHKLDEKLNVLATSGEKGKAFAIANSFSKKLAQTLSSESTREKLGHTFGMTACTLQIQYAMKPIDTIKMTAEHLGYDFDKIKENGMHHDKYYLTHKWVSGHPEFFNTEDNPLLSKVSLRGSVKDATTISSGIGQMHSYQVLDDQIKAIIKENKQTKKELSEIKAKQMIQEVDLKHIQDVSGWVGDPREKARNLRQADYTYKQIANVMGKGESTIRRWLSE